MTKFKEWLRTKPKVIQELGKKYPPSEYIIKKNAPYGISCEGTKVELCSYCENGNVTVVVMAKNKLQSAIEHETILAMKYNRTPEELKEINMLNIKVEIDPIWLDIIEK